MSNTLEEFVAKFRSDELSILRNAHWNWSVRPVHSTLGAGVLSLNRFCTSFAEITPEEGASLAAIVKELDGRLKAVFAPQKMNYMMLMMVDVHLHFHVLPRYAEPKEFGGLTWTDSGWPALPAMGDYADRASDPALLLIRDALK